MGIDRTKYASAAGVSRGAYVLLKNGDGLPELILMATGSEVSLMIEAHELLTKEGVKVSSVSVPCLELFLRQPQAYQEEVLPRGCRARVSIEAAVKASWGSLIGLDGEHVGMITFGVSGPAKKLQQELGFTPQAVVAAGHRVMAGEPRTSAHESAVMTTYNSSFGRRLWRRTSWWRTPMIMTGPCRMPTSPAHMCSTDVNLDVSWGFV